MVMQKYGGGKRRKEKEEGEKEKGRRRLTQLSSLLLQYPTCRSLIVC